MRMSTKERLAVVLRQEGLLGLAGEALLGRFDDYETKSATPIGDLVRCLRARGREDLAQRAIGGEWDGTEEEARRWYEQGKKRWYAREGRAMIERGRRSREEIE